MKLLIVDGTNVVMRYASAMLKDVNAPAEGEVEKVVRAVERTIRECAATADATHLIVALDSSVASWRKEMFAEYKAKRTTPTSVWSNRLHLHLSALGILALRWPGDEADDIVATLALRAMEKGGRAAVLSGDSDLLGLADLADVYQFGGKGEPRHVLRTGAWVAEKYGLTSSAHLWPYKALVGEPGDGIPGVPKIGPVRARALLASEDTMDLGEHREWYRTALRLVSPRFDVPLDPVRPSQCVLPEVAHA